MDRIKYLRNAQTPKMSQEKLGHLVGVGRTAVAMWEAGKSEPDNATLIKLAEIFDVSADYLLELTDKSDEVDSTEKNKPINNVIKIAGRDGSMLEYTVSDSQRELIKQVLENLKPVDDEDV